METLITIIFILTLILFLIYLNNEDKEVEEIMPSPKDLKRIKTRKQIIVLLDKYSFVDADKLFFNKQNLSKSEYENLKKRYLKKYLDEQLKERLGFSMDNEKAIALAKLDQNLLLKSRAGTGKTSTLAYKTYFLIHKQNVLPCEIMILAFNKKAAEEIKNRIRNDFGMFSFTNSRTFHSFAYQIARPKKRLLIDQELYVQKIVKKITGKNVNPDITQVFTQFIQKAKKLRISFKEMEEKIDGFETKDFLKLANKIYKEYSESLERDNCMDFDDLITEAIKMIEKTKGECRIKGVKLNNLKYLLIDEYQDFSKLFYDLIQAIRKYNSEIRLFCVGDDCQSINGFAGSDLKYFNDFIKYFDNSNTTDLSTNYRSKKEIVDCGNRFMLREEEKSNYQEGNEGGEIVVRYIDSGNSINEYLKLCAEIIKDNPNKTIAILYRKNEINNITLELFYKRLARFGNIRDRITISTIHKFKGQEADLVIILQAVKKLFPLIHPHNDLFKIFGQSKQEILDEEKRLFYVAISRAKEKLFILTERDNESRYLEMIER